MCRAMTLLGQICADSRGQRYVAGETTDRDELQKSGRWIATDHVVEAQQ